MIVSTYDQPNHTRVLVRLESSPDGAPERFVVTLYDITTPEQPRILDWANAYSIGELREKLKDVEPLYLHKGKISA